MPSDKIQGDYLGTSNLDSWKKDLYKPQTEGNGGYLSALPPGAEISLFMAKEPTA